MRCYPPGRWRLVFPLPHPPYGGTFVSSFTATLLCYVPKPLTRPVACSSCYGFLSVHSRTFPAHPCSCFMPNAQTGHALPTFRVTFVQQRAGRGGDEPSETNDESGGGRLGDSNGKCKGGEARLSYGLCHGRRMKNPFVSGLFLHSRVHC